MTIVLYGSERSPPCRAVLMGLKQLNLEVERKSLDMKNKEHLSPEFLKINPAHCIPTIVDGDVSLWESRAILQYLANKYAPDSTLYPSDPKKRSTVDRTLNFDMTLFGSIKEGLLSKMYRGVDPTEQAVNNLKNNLKLLDTLIGDNKYVAGSNLTIADLAVLASITVLAINDYKDLEGLSNLKAWFERLSKELPYFDEVNGGVAEAMKQRLAQKQ